MNEIKMIPIGQLKHHPDNPRKDLGDLVELTESIKTRGIMQNLTVVPDMETKKYLVVIGNRRLEAAKAAGLVELPCAIDTQMDEKEQMATMLMENMQRQDLTVYEQAEGFQMMMNLGYTEKEIGEKTGFSTKTVKDRLKLTKLNKKEFGKAVNQGATLLDLLEVTKLDSKADQKEVMDAAGTENFRARMQTALRKQEFAKNKKRLEPVVRELMPEIPANERYSSKWEKYWNESFKMDGDAEALKKHIQQKIMRNKELPYRYGIEEYGTGEIVFYKGKPKAAPMTEEEKTERQKSLLRTKHLRLVKNFWEQAYELRKDFVKNYTVTNGQSASTMGKIIVRRALEQCDEWDGKLKASHNWDDAYIRDVLGLPENPEEKPGQDPNVPSWRKNYFSIWEKVDGKTDVPMVRAMVAWAVGGGLYWPDGPEHGLYDSVDGKYSKGSGMGNGVDKLYDFLMEIGYQLSDMEKQLLDGTHECYQREDE